LQPHDPDGISILVARSLRVSTPPLRSRRSPGSESKVESPSRLNTRGALQLAADLKADVVTRRHPRQLQPTLNFALMEQLEGFARELTVPPSNSRITGRTQWFGFPKAG
jgi:hypothetical protein